MSHDENDTRWRALDADLDRAYAAFDTEVDFEARASELHDAIARSPAGARRRNGRLFGLIAAALLPFLITILVLVVPTGSKSLLAETLRRLEEVSTLECRLRTPAPGQVLRERMAVALGSRVDTWEHGRLVATRLIDVDGWATWINHEERCAVRQVNPGTGERNFYDSEHDPRVFLAVLKGAIERATEELPRATMHGKTVAGFAVAPAAFTLAIEAALPERSRRLHVAHQRMGRAGRDEPTAAGDWAARIWIDVATNLPVRFERRFPRWGIELVSDDMQWNAPVEPGDFMVPDGYAIRDEHLHAKRAGTARDLRTMLEHFAALSGGAFPMPLTNIGGQARMALATQHGIEPERLAGAARERFRESDLGRHWQGYRARIAEALAFLYEIYGTDGTDPEYFGDRVRFGDGDRVLLRWKQGDGTARELLGDLRIEEGR